MVQVTNKELILQLRYKKEDAFNYFEKHKKLPVIFINDKGEYSVNDPVKKVVNKGAGAGVLKDVPLMVRLTEACVKSTRLPVTVKTRLGWDDAVDAISVFIQQCFFRRRNITITENWDLDPGIVFDFTD